MFKSEMTGNLLFFSSRAAKTAKIVANADVKPEALLVERICAGDGAAFEELYRMFAPLVHGILLARVSPGEVDDLVQDVFLSAYQNLPALRDPNAVGAWLATIARNSATEFYRRTRPSEELSEDLTRNDDSHAQAQEILAIIQTLPETYKETLILRLVEGLTGAEIAAQCNLTPESVRVNLHRGMKLLREKLGITESN